MLTPNFLNNTAKSNQHNLKTSVRHMMQRPMAIGSVCLMLGFSALANAAPNNTQQTLPVRNGASLPTLSNLSGTQVTESRSRTVSTQSASQSAAKQKSTTAATTDRMGQLIDHKSVATTNKAIPKPALPDTISATALTRQDEISESSDDIADGQAVASPDSTDAADAISTNPSTQTTQMTGSSDDAAIKSIEAKDGKKLTTLDLSSYARQVNSATWSPKMKVNSAMTIKMQALMDWNHASPGPIDGGWGMNSKKALINFQTMQGLPADGKMNQATWDALIKNIPANKPVLVTYTLTDEDVNTSFAPTPGSSEAKSKMKGLYYQDIKEMLGERFHMDVRYLEKLNKGKTYKAGETITVVNTRTPLKSTITRVVADKAAKTLFAYNGDKLVATYPTTVGSDSTPSPHGTYKIVNKVKMPWYKATVGEDKDKQVYMLPPGPNNPVGVVWMGLSKPSYGLHGSPVPEGISRQASHGCIRLTNWDVLEVYANIENGATVELK